MGLTGQLFVHTLFLAQFFHFLCDLAIFLLFFNFVWFHEFFIQFHIFLKKIHIWFIWWPLFSRQIYFLNNQFDRIHYHHHRSKILYLFLMFELFNRKKNCPSFSEISQNTQWARKFKKVQSKKKLIKSNKTSISQIFLTKIHFLPFLKLQKIEFGQKKFFSRN